MSILVIGHLHQDYVVYSETLPQVGETIMGTQYLEAMGGKGHNQALAALKAGGAVTLVACVGNEAPVQDHLEYLKISGMAVHKIKTSATSPTGKAFITVDALGDTHITVYPGANHDWRPAELRQAIAGEYRFALLQTELGQSLTEAAVDDLHARGIPIILNLSPFTELSADTLSKVSVLVAKEHEAAALAHYPLHGDTDAAKVSLALHLRYGIPEVGIIRKGLMLSYRQGQQHYLLKTRSFAALDTSGAVDVFCGYLAELKVDNRPLRHALRLSLQAACQTVLHKGAGTNIPTAESIAPVEIEILEGI